MDPLADSIPVHDLDDPGRLVLLKKISHKNHYDFTRKHRHSYFEVMFFIGGGGSQLIDFVAYDVKPHSCYIIHPQQIHLLKRAPESDGFIIQFPEESIFPSTLQQLLRQRVWTGQQPILFEENKDGIMKFMPLIELFKNHQGQKAKYGKEALIHLLHTLLYDLFSRVDSPVPSSDLVIYEFQQLIDLHFRDHHAVGYYLDQLSIGEKKLNVLSRKHLGMTPLQVIHSRILLEVKRHLVFAEKSHKEIAYDLGFDSPASFSAFIKKKTGSTATAIQRQLTDIHNR